MTAQDRAAQDRAARSAPILPAPITGDLVWGSPASAPLVGPPSGQCIYTASGAGIGTDTGAGGAVVTPDSWINRALAAHSPEMDAAAETALDRISHLASGTAAAWLTPGHLAHHTAGLDRVAHHLAPEVRASTTEVERRRAVAYTALYAERVAIADVGPTAIEPLRAGGQLPTLPALQRAAGAWQRDAASAFRALIDGATLDRVPGAPETLGVSVNPSGAARYRRQQWALTDAAVLHPFGRPLTQIVC